MKKQTILSEMSSWNISFKHSPWSVALGSMFVLFLSACGGDSSSSGPSDNATSESDIIEATFDDLPVCTSKREGVTAYVKDEKIAYICIDEDWILDGDESPSSSVSQSDNDESSSSVDKTKSSSSRHCEDCKDDAISSSSTDKVISSSSSSSTNEQNSSTSEQLNIVVIKDKSYTGVSQKGPFVTGSAVKLYELDGKTYAQTGKSFTGKITTDDGKFSISSVTLASQYALLEANGYYRNEITGDKSKGPVSLNAFTDLSDRKTVNVNLLTHLEYERALHLVGIGVEVSSAKKQAETEILNAFGIKGDFASSEDLDIFSKGDGNAALLAFSVLMLRDLSEADLTELLTKFATDIESDGSWDDEDTKTKIADWAQAKDLSGELATIRSNIEKWKLGTVPEFEKYVRNFWYTNYGLGVCSDNRKGEVLAAKNEKSVKYNTRERYICKSGTWIIASDIEKDTYQWTKGKVGEIKKGNVSDTYYGYDGMNWIAVSDREVSIGLCTKERNGKIEKYDDVYFICKSNEWIEASVLEYDTYEMNCTKDGMIVNGRIESTNNYVCDADTFRAAADLEVLLKKGCVSYVLESEYMPTGQLSYYRCEKAGEWFFDKEKNLGTMIDSRDEKTYRTTTIGTQVWMAENLNNEKSGGLCYENEPDNCTKYGRLYDWGSARKACPPNWHLPDTTEWNTLFTSIGGKSNAGIVLKSTTGWTSENGKDLYGFTMLQTGYYWQSEFSTNSVDYFWSSRAEIVDGHSVGGRIMLLGNNASEGWNHYGFACNIRCVKD